MLEIFKFNMCADWIQELKEPSFAEQGKAKFIGQYTCFKIGVAQFSLNIWASEYVKQGTGLSSAYYI